MSICIGSIGVLREMGMRGWVRYRKSVEEGIEARPLKRIHGEVSLGGDR